MSSLLAEPAIQAVIPARITSIILGPAVCAALMLTGAAVAGGAGTRSTLTAATTVLILPYLTGWAFKERRLPATWPHRTRSALRHGAAAAVGTAGLFATHAAGAPAELMQTSITLIAGSVILGLGRAWTNASAHVGMVTLLALWLASSLAPVSVFALLLVPVMVWSRVLLREHTGTQAVSGIVTGIAVFVLYLILHSA
ncbi:hypothetical protein [Arthrobacter sp. H14]|uniref:hypothetical protein n=1 Tax=Arthrobacter sp. H14 TaxID=1312959 RepID=UPI00047D6EE8|nr:hypothetical protein [Arthrobacter sp. H14]